MKPHIIVNDITYYKYNKRTAPDGEEEGEDIDAPPLYINYGGLLYRRKDIPKPKKDWEILEFRKKDGSKPKRFELYGNNAIIHSVKRLSDGEVFTVGDQVHVHNSETLWTIRGFEIVGRFNEMMCITISGSRFSIKSITETFTSKKQKLFTTEDGVDIYIDQKVWVVGTKYFDMDDLKMTRTDYKNAVDHWGKWGVDYKYFSSKEKAEEYILINRPCLSVNDLLEDGFVSKLDSKLGVLLIELAKSKINTK